MPSSGHETVVDAAQIHHSPHARGDPDSCEMSPLRHVRVSQRKERAQTRYIAELEFRQVEKDSLDVSSREVGGRWQTPGS